MMNESFFLGILSTASSLLSTLLDDDLAVVGLVYVRRVHTLAGFCFLGAGALGAFSSLIQRIAGLAMSFGAGMTVYTIVQIFTTLVAMVGGLLVPTGIFLLADAIKKGRHANP